MPKYTVAVEIFEVPDPYGENASDPVRQLAMREAGVYEDVGGALNVVTRMFDNIPDVEEDNINSYTGNRPPGQTRVDIQKDYAAQIARNIAQLNVGGAGGNNTLIVSVGDVYLQFLSARGATDAMWETVSNHFLPAELRLSDEQIAKLHAMGFADPHIDNDNCRNCGFGKMYHPVTARMARLPGPGQSIECSVAEYEPSVEIPAGENTTDERGSGSPNFSQRIDLLAPGRAQQVASATLSILHEVYGCIANSPIRIQLTLEAWRPAGGPSS